jgi:hypothetical protein
MQYASTRGFGNPHAIQISLCVLFVLGGVNVNARTDKEKRKR